MSDANLHGSGCVRVYKSRESIIRVKSVPTLRSNSMLNNSVVSHYDNLGSMFKGGAEIAGVDIAGVDIEGVAKQQ